MRRKEFLVSQLKGMSVDEWWSTPEVIHIFEQHGSYFPCPSKKKIGHLCRVPKMSYDYLRFLKWNRPAGCRIYDGFVFDGTKIAQHCWWVDDSDSVIDIIAERRFKKNVEREYLGIELPKFEDVFASIWDSTQLSICDIITLKNQMPICLNKIRDYLSFGALKESKLEQENVA